MNRKKGRGFSLACLVFLLAIVIAGCHSGPTLLEPHQTIFADTPGDGLHFYQFEADSGQFVRLHLEQLNADLTFKINGPSGGVGLVRDSLNHRFGSELACFITRESGPYLVEVAAFSESGDGNYHISLDPPRLPSQRDKQLARAFELETLGDNLGKHEQPDSQEQALGHYKNAEALWHQTGEIEQVALTLLKRADLLGRRHQYDLQIDALTKAASHFDALGKTQNQALTLFNLGGVYSGQGLLENAIETFNMVLKLRAKPDLTRADALVEQGFTHVYAGLNEESQTYFEQAQEIYTHQDHIPGLAKIQRELGRRDCLQGRTSQGIVHLQKALTLIENRRDFREVGILDTLGKCLTNAERFDEAMAAFEKALALVPDSLGSAWTPDLKANMGELLVKRGRPKEGLPYLSGAIESFKVSGKVAGRAHALYNRARAKRALGRLAEALKDMRLAMALSEQMRNETASQDMRAAYRDSRYPYRDFFLELLIAWGEQESIPDIGIQALEVIEGARARILVENLCQTELKGAENSELVNQKRHLQTRIATLAWRQSQDRRDPQNQPRGDEELDRLIDRYDQLDAKIRVAQNLNQNPFPQLGVEDIQSRLLDDQTTLLYYAMGETHAWLWVVEKAAVNYYRLGFRTEIEGLAREYAKRVKNRDVARFRHRVQEVGSKLSELLLGPVTAKLNYKRLLITTDGDLHYIPFGALPSPNQPNRPMVSRHELVTLHSASALASLRQRNASRARAGNDLIIFANPAFHVENEFGRLEFTRKEAQGIAALSKEEVHLFLGVAATKERVLNADLTRAQILHFATHGLLYPNRAELSALMLATVDEAGQPIDGFLRSYEIRDLKLAADLVVLSACETALGEEMRGEGLIGLPQSFMEAGAASVLVSLWQVDDQASMELMLRFYRFLHSEGLAPAAALAKAQDEISQKEAWQDPYFWSGFVFQGDWRGLTK